MLILCSIIISITLEKAVKIALENNLSIISAKYSVSESELSYKGAWSNIFPKITVDSSYRRQLKIPEVEIQGRKIKAGKAEQSQITLSAIEIIPLGGSAWYLKDAQKYAYDSQIFSFENLKNEIGFAVINSYISITQLLLAKKIAEENFERMQKHYETAKALYDAGVIIELYLLRIETALFESEQQLKNIEIQLQNLLKNFSILLGSKDENEIIPSETIDDLISSYKPEEFLENLKEKIKSEFVENTPDILSLKYSVKQIDNLSKAQRGALFPQLSLGFSLLNSFGTFVEQRNIPVLSIGAILSIDFGGTYFSYLSLKQRKMALLTRLDEIKNTKRKDFEMLLKEYEVVKSKLYTSQKRFESSERALKSAEELFKVGKITSVDLLDYEIQFENSKFDVISSKSELFLLMWKALRILGEIEEFITKMNG